MEPLVVAFVKLENEEKQATRRYQTKSSKIDGFAHGVKL